MNLLDLMIKIGADDQASGTISKLSSTVGKGLAAAASVGAAAVGAAAKATVSLVSESVENFKDFEQLAGGVTTLFGEAADTVFSKSEEAYKNAGMSANEYMETVTSFAASLVSGLGGDTEQAANMANTAIEDMSDNANKMGTDLSSIQNAYQGFAKQNYTMLDNLKLGYGGTASEMVRLINDSGVLNETITSMDGISFDTIISAIHKVQENMGITGTTSKEAATTIEGSLGMLKSSWENVLTSMSGGTEDFTMNFDAAIDSLVDSALTFESNIEPVITKALDGISTLIEKLAPRLTELLPGIIESLLPTLLSSITQLISGAAGVIPTLISLIVSMLPEIIQAGIQILSALMEGITQNIPTLVNAAIDIIQEMCQFLIDNAGNMVDAAVDIIMALADGLIEAIPVLMEMIPQIITALVTKLTDPDMIVSMVEVSLQIILALAQGLITAIPQLIAAIPTVIINLASALLQAAPKVLEIGGQIMDSLGRGIVSSVVAIGNAIMTIRNAITNKITELVNKAVSWGHDLIMNFVQGIKDRISAVINTVKNVAQTVRDFLGFSEPEEGPLSNFHSFAPDMMDLFAKGIEDNTDVVTDQIAKSFDFGDSLITSTDTGTQNYSGSTASSDPITIIVQSVLDGKVIGETVSKYTRQKARAYGV